MMVGLPIVQNGLERTNTQIPQSSASQRRESLACVVNGELGSLLAVIRRSQIYAGQHKAGDERFENFLIHSLKSLRRQIFSWKQPWNMIDPCIYLKPLTEIIRSEGTGAPVAVAALSAVYKMLSLQVFDLNTVNVEDAMHSIVEAVTSCLFDVPDSASEEALSVKMLQVLQACMKSNASLVLRNQDICTIVNTCFRLVYQAGAKSEVLQQVSRQTMRDIVRIVYSRLPEFDRIEDGGHKNSRIGKVVAEGIPEDENSDARENNGNLESPDAAGTSTSGFLESPNQKTETGKFNNDLDDDERILAQPYGVPCMVEIFYFLCSLLNIVQGGAVRCRSNITVFDEDVPLFALGLINSIVELGGKSICRQPKLLALTQDHLFRNLIIFGFSPSPLVLNMVCSIVLSLYHHARNCLKLQLEAFFSFVLFRIIDGRAGAPYQQQQIALEALVDFCRQPAFMSEVYANFDCDITCVNAFEEIGNLLSRTAFPFQHPLSEMHIIALDGLIAVLHSMANKFSTATKPPEPLPIIELKEYKPFWMIDSESCDNAERRTNLIRLKKHIKRRLAIGADHFNRDPKKGLEFLQGSHVLPEQLDPQSVACFLRHTAGLDKSLVGDFLGNHDKFCVQVLREFVKTFNFRDMNLDMALRLFLGTFRLPGESQKIERVLEAFSGRYYEQSSGVMANKDAAFILCYSLIMLNTDIHNPTVKNKMTEEEFIRNNRGINGGNDFPREYLSELYHSIANNEIKTTYAKPLALSEMTTCHWMDLIRKSESTAPYIVSSSELFLDHDMFAILSGPSIAAISVMFDYAEEEDVLHKCFDGFLAVAKISAYHHLEDVLDDLIVSLCKFTTLANSSPQMEELPSLANFVDDIKAGMATVTLFTIAQRFGDFIRTGWRNILECILKLNKMGLLPSSFVSDAADDPFFLNDSVYGKPVTANSALSIRGTPYGSMGGFSQLPFFEHEDPLPQTTEQLLAAYPRLAQTLQNCQIGGIFTESKCLHAQSLLQLSRALICAAGRPQKNGISIEDEETAVFCLDLLFVITLNNSHRVMLLWDSLYDYITVVVRTTIAPGPLIKKAILGLIHVCQRLLPLNANFADDLLVSLQLILKLDARVADAYCEQITQEVLNLLRPNIVLVESRMAWRTLSCLLCTTAAHPEASAPGFEILSFVMTDSAHITPVNFLFFIDAARAFAESWIAMAERCLRALDLMEESVKCLVKWSSNANTDHKHGGIHPKKTFQPDQAHEIGDLWLCLVHGIRKISLQQREGIRNYALKSLRSCLLAAQAIRFEASVWLKCYDRVLFPMLDDLLDIANRHSEKEYRNLDGTLYQAFKFVSEIFLQFMEILCTLPGFRKLWLGLLSHLEKYRKAKTIFKRGASLEEDILKMLKNMLRTLKRKDIIEYVSDHERDGLWELTWLYVKGISPSLQAELFPDEEAGDPQGEANDETDELVTSQVVTEGGTVNADS